MTMPIAPSEPEQFRDIVAARFGLWFDDSKLTSLGELLQRRARSRGLAVPHYLAQLSGDGDEAGALASELTVGETYFFRNGDQFRALEQIIAERMSRRGTNHRLSFLSAGCSSGEEPYTIAMLAHAAVPMPPWQLSIRAVDLNPEALRKAAAGRYGSWALRETSPEMLRQWFVPHGKDQMISDQLRGTVQFDCRNLADPDSDIWQPGAYDAIFCRNVIMYMRPATQQAVIRRIAQSLAPGGYLFLGHAETLRGLSQDFHLVHSHGTFYYQRKASHDEAASHIDRSGSYPAQIMPLPAIPPAASDTGWFDAIDRASRRIAALTQPPAPAIAVPVLPIPHWNLEVALDLLQRERFGEALDLIERLPAEAAEDPDVMLLRALLFVQGGQPEAAEQSCRALLARDGLNAGANYVLALCLEAEGNSQAAVQQYGMASHLDPQFAMPLLRRGLLARRAGDRVAAVADLRRARLLLESEDTSRLLLFGGGFTRGALSRLCEAELAACETGQ